MTMDDLHRLKKRLAAALIAAPLVAACGPSQTQTPVKTSQGEQTFDEDGPGDPEPPPPEPLERPNSAVCLTPNEADQVRIWGEEVCPRQVSHEGVVGMGKLPPGTHTGPFFEGYDLYLHPQDTQTSRDAGVEDECCYQLQEIERRPMRGRPLIDSTGLHRATLRQGNAWGQSTQQTADLPLELRQRIADEWRHDALMEHASVASFARAALELMSLAAPPHLVDGCLAAGRDEVRHAERCFALASSYSGTSLEAGPLALVAPRPLTWAELAVHTFEEGCVEETLATLDAQRALARCTAPEAAVALSEIAEDEARHAELAWITVAFALAQGGAPARTALTQRYTALRDSFLAQPPCQPHPWRQALNAQGRLDEAQRAHAVRDGWRVIDELIAMVLPA